MGGTQDCPQQSNLQVYFRKIAPAKSERIINGFYGANSLEQRWANDGPRVACVPRKVFMWPADSFLGVQSVEKTVCSKSITPE